MQGTFHLNLTLHPLAPAIFWFSDCLGTDWSRVTTRTILVYSGIFTFLVDAYPTYSASALAANSFMRSSFGGIFPLFGIQSKSIPVLYRFLFSCPRPGPGLCFACACQEASCPQQTDVSPSHISKWYMYCRAVCGEPGWTSDWRLHWRLWQANGRAVYNNLGYHWATSLLAFLTLAMLPFP